MARDEKAEAVRQFYRRAGAVQFANHIIDQLQAETSTWKHPYTNYENYAGYMAVIDMLLEWLEETNGI